MSKYGRRYGRQRYRCDGCGGTFQSKKRVSVRSKNLWRTFVLKRQTFGDLSEADGRSVRQLQRVVHKEAGRKRSVVRASVDEPVVLVMDTTYFPEFGVMVFRCAKRRQNLFWTFVKTETNEEYLSGLAYVQSLGFNVVAVVCDGKRWLGEQISHLGLPVQLCQFHLVKTVTKCTTKKPKTEAGRELRWLALSLKDASEEEFTERLNRWDKKWHTFLNEKTITPQTGRWQYTHRNLRAGIRTIHHWLPRLFTCKNYPELTIPNTTNSLDGTFSHLKQKVNTHRGINVQTKRKMISLILSQKSKPKRKKPT